VSYHEHFCETHDARWACWDSPCLRHEAADCRSKPHLRRKSTLTLADYLARLVLDEAIPRTALAAAAREYLAARR
jgi:hypothetical protein